MNAKKIAAVMCAMALGAAQTFGQAGGWQPLPSTGYWQHLLHLGADFDKDMLADADDKNGNGDLLAMFGFGAQTEQRPYHGLEYNFPESRVKSGSATNLVWSEIRRAEDGANTFWTPVPNQEEYVKYWHIYIHMPDDAERLASARFYNDDQIRAWNNGALFASRDDWDDNQERSYDAKLFPGLNSITIKLREGGSGDRMAMRVTDRFGASFTDLRYALDVRLLISDMAASDIAQESATINAFVGNSSGEACEVSVGIAASDLGTDIAAWESGGAVFTLAGVGGRG